MRWLVCISTAGIEQQIMAGKDEKAQKRVDLWASKNKTNNLCIKFVFEKEKNPYSDSWSGAEYLTREFTEFKSNIEHDIMHKNGFDTRSSHGYNVRKTTLTDYIEVLADLSEKDYTQFSKKYSGLDGAIDVLLSAERITSGVGRKSAGDAITYWLRKLQFEKEYNRE